MIESLKPFGFVYTYDPLIRLKNVVAEAIEASKEGGLFKRRENWKGKAGFMKKIDKLYNEWTEKIGGDPYAFFREVPYHFNWKPKDAEVPHDYVSERADAFRRGRQTGFNSLL